MQPYRNLEVWRRAHRLALEVYRLTSAFPESERFGLTSQARRAAASIPANIAEGSVRSPNEYRHHLRISLGSAAELDYHLLLAADLGLLESNTHQTFEKELDEIKRMLFSLQQAVGRK